MNGCSTSKNKPQLHNLGSFWLHLRISNDALEPCCSMSLPYLRQGETFRSLLAARYFFSLLVTFCSLLVISLLVACCSLRFARCSLLFARYVLLLARYFLLITFARCSLLFARCSLLFTRCSTKNSEGLFLVKVSKRFSILFCTKSLICE